MRSRREQEQATGIFGGDPSREPVSVRYIIVVAASGEVVGFIDDDHVPPAGREFPKGALAPFDEVYGGDHTRLDRPRIGSGFERPAGFGHTFAVKDPELEAELGGEFGLPLLEDRCRADDKYPVGPAAGIQFPEDQAGFNGFAEADVVSDEQPRTREFERSNGGHELIRLEADAGSCGGNQAIVAGREAETHAVHQQLKTREPSRAGEVEFGDFVRFDLFQVGQDRNLLITPGLVEAAKTQAAQSLPGSVRNHVGCNNNEPGAACADGRPGRILGGQDTPIMSARSHNCDGELLEYRASR